MVQAKYYREKHLPIGSRIFLWSPWLRVALWELAPSHSQGHRCTIAQHKESRAGERSGAFSIKWVRICVDLFPIAATTTGSKTKRHWAVPKGSLVGPKVSNRASAGSLLQKRFGPLGYSQCFHKEGPVNGPWFIFSYFCKPSHFSRHVTTKN